MGWLLLALAGILGVTFIGVSSAKKNKEHAAHEHSRDKGKRYIKRDKLEEIRKRNRKKVEKELIEEVQEKNIEMEDLLNKNKGTKVGGIPPKTGVAAPIVEPVKIEKPPKDGPTKVGGLPPKTGVAAPVVKPVTIEKPKKESAISAKEAKKTLRKLEKKVLDATEVKKPESVVEQKIASMTNIEMKHRARPERKEHNAYVTSAVMKKWDSETTKVYETVVGLMEDVDKGENPQDVLTRRPEVPNFKKFVVGSDKVVTMTSEKYDFYHLFIVEKSEEILQRLGPIDPRRTEIEGLRGRIATKIDNFESSLDDFLVFVEADLTKLENIEKEVIDRQKTVGAYRTKKELEKYKATILSGKGRDGRTVNELIETRMTNMEIEGKISLSNNTDRETIFKVVKGEWEKKAANAIKRSDSLIDKLSDKNNYEEIAKSMPKMSIDKFINSAECRNLIGNTHQKLTTVHKYGELMRKEFANNLALLKDEELKTFVHEKMNSLNVDVSNPKITVEEFKRQSKGTFEMVMDKIQIANQNMLAIQQAKRQQELAQQNMNVTPSGIILSETSEKTPKKEIIVPNSQKR